MLLSGVKRVKGESEAVETQTCRSTKYHSGGNLRKGEKLVQADRASNGRRGRDIGALWQKRISLILSNTLFVLGTKTC